MKSIPAAMTWELFDRSRWSLLAAALGSFAFPLLVLSSLAHEGALNPDDKSMLIMHIVMVQMNAFAFGAALFAGTWQMRPLYAYPASAATLVAWRLLPAIIAMLIETVAWTGALNALYRVDWPLWGPALYSAVAYAAVVATVWLTEKSRWMVAALCVVSAALGLWFKSRYVGLFSEAAHQWDAVTPSEVLTLLAIAGLAYWVAVVAVSRNRRGERPFSLGIAAWFDRLFDRAPAARSPFRSPQHAQFWYVWRSGWIAPAVVAGVLFVGFVIWFFSSRDPQQLVECLVGGGPLLMCAAFVGAATMGNVSRTNDLTIKQFQATRPLTTSDFSRTILRAAATSLLIAWTIWAVVTMAVVSVLEALGDPLSSPSPDVLNWKLIPATLVGSWVIMGGFISILLTGRSRLMMRVFVTLMAAYIGGIVLVKFALSSENVKQAMQAIAVLLGVAFVLGTIWAFIAARRRGLVDAATTWAAFAVWAALVVVTVFMLMPPYGPAAAYSLAIGVLSLAVAPLAAAPLALAWNRHR